MRLALGEILYLIYWYFGVAALWYLASVVCLVHSFVTAANTTERNQVKWILYGVVASLVPIGYSWYLACADAMPAVSPRRAWHLSSAQSPCS